MIETTLNGLSYLQFENFANYSELLHFSTLRSGGSSTENYHSLNLGFNSGDDPEKVKANRVKLCNSIGIDPASLIFPKQTHTGTVKIITTDFFNSSEEDQKAYLQDTDALITNLMNVCVTIKTADCVPVLIYDPKQKVIAAIHAGWRGTVQMIVQNTIQEMIKSFGSDPRDLIAGIGPSISPEVYEVGSEVLAHFDPSHFNSKDDNKGLLNLWEANKQQLLGNGIQETHIEIAKACTWTNAEKFFSARRDGAKTGRMATGLILK